MRQVMLVALFLALPVVSAHPVRGQSLLASVFVDTLITPTWTYTIRNDEPASSSNWVSDFFLPIFAPIDNVESPRDWFVDTDYFSYVRWYNVEAYPYPNDIPPGTLAAGFSFQTAETTFTQSEFLVSSWDHHLDWFGPWATGSVRVPFARPNAVPEPGLLGFAIGAMLFGLSIAMLHRRLRRSIRYAQCP